MRISSFDVRRTEAFLCGDGCSEHRHIGIAGSTGKATTEKETTRQRIYGKSERKGKRCFDVFLAEGARVRDVLPRSGARV